MKKLLTILLFLGFGFGVFGQGYWEELVAPPGGKPTQVVETPNGVLYAKYDDFSIYTSKDFGSNWVCVFAQEDIDSLEVTSIHFGNKGTIFLTGNNSTGAFERYSSSDEGITWQKFTSSIPLSNLREAPSGSLYGYSLVLNTGQGYASTLYKSDNFGLNWDTCYYEFTGLIDHWKNLSINSQGRIIIRSEQSLDFSLDGGNNWSSAPIPLTSTSKLFFSPTNTFFTWSPLYPGTLDRRTIAGVTSSFDFNILLPTVGGLYIHDFYVLQDTLILSGGSALFYSIDDGVSWSILDSFVDQKITFPIWTKLSNGSYLVSTADGMVRANSFNENWTLSSNGINKVGILRFFSQTDTTYLAETEYGLWRYNTISGIWSLINDSGIPFNPRLYISSRTALSSEGSIGIFMYDSLKIIKGTSELLLRPDDGMNKYFWGLGFGTNDSTIFISSTNGTSRTMDGGLTWNLVTDSLFVDKIEVAPNGILFGSFSYFAPSGHIHRELYKSTDLGLNWNTVRSLSRDFEIDNNGYVYVPTSSRMYISKDSGDSWLEIPLPESVNNVSISNQGPVFLNDRDTRFASYSLGESWQTIPSFPSGSNNIEPNSYAFDITNDNYLVASIYSTFGCFNFLRSSRPITEGVYLQGIVEKDGDQDCATINPTQGLSNWIIKADGEGLWYSNTDSVGKYSIFVDTGDYIVSANPSISNIFWDACVNNQVVSLPILYDTVYIDFLNKALTDCAYMGIDLATSFLEKCFNSPAYLSYCNYGTIPADSAYVEVQLDPKLSMTSSQIPYDSLGGGLYRFPLGFVDVGACGQFSFELLTDCDSTLLGETLCLSAHIYPDSICVPIPGWSGAELSATARCEGDTVIHFDVTNHKQVGSQNLDYIIVEDDVVLRQGQNTYGPGETKTMSVSMPDGHFLRLESDQEPNHPFSNQIAAWVEGCGGTGSLGFVNQYFIDNGIVSEDVKCIEVVGSYDPNDKRGFPLGYGSDKLIKANQPLEYVIRFQNTGTAPAHFVVIRDTLSALLDPTTIRMGASSHPYTWQLSGQGNITVRFEGINLPDSTTNAAESQGFISFYINQQPDLPDGSVIENRASIYFDYNGAIQTNTSVHRIGQDFLTVSLEEVFKEINVAVQVLPNPISEQALLLFSEKNTAHFSGKNELQFTLTDVSGNVLRQSGFYGNRYLFERESIASGLYFFAIKSNSGQAIASGKLIINH